MDRLHAVGCGDEEARAGSGKHDDLPPRDPRREPPTPVLKDIFAAAAGGVGYNPSVYLPGTVLDTYFQVIQGLISGQIGGEDGMKQLQAKMAEAK